MYTIIASFPGASGAMASLRRISKQRVLVWHFIYFPNKHISHKSQFNYINSQCMCMSVMCVWELIRHGNFFKYLRNTFFQEIQVFKIILYLLIIYLFQCEKSKVFHILVFEKVF